MHEFMSSLEVEQRWNPVIDEFIRGLGYEVRPVEMADQWRGIDRVIKSQADGGESTIEYKVDRGMRRTGNYFIEHTSNDQTGREGWALTSKADYLMLFTPYLGNERAHVALFRMADIRQALPEWRARYRTAAAANRGYNTLGVCVPKAVAWDLSLAQGRIDLP